MAKKRRAQWLVGQPWNKNAKIADEMSTFWENENGLKPKGSVTCSGLELDSLESQKSVQKSTTRRIPRWSPSQVLTPPNRA